VSAIGGGGRGGGEGVACRWEKKDSERDKKQGLINTSAPIGQGWGSFFPANHSLVRSCRYVFVIVSVFVIQCDEFITYSLPSFSPNFYTEHYLFHLFNNERRSYSFDNKLPNI
jgi:hypothetical protein